MKNFSVVLIDPPFFSFLDESQNGLPLGLAYLAGSLQAHGYSNVHILNADIVPGKFLPPSGKDRHNEVQKFHLFESRVKDAEDLCYKYVIETLNEHSPDVIGISIRTAKFFISKILVERIRNEFPQAVIVAGGPHASSCPEDVLRIVKPDIVVRGEGEVTFVELVKCIEEGRDYSALKGISYLSDGKLITNPMRPYVENIDDIPFPARNVVLNADLMSPNDFGLLFTSRGCPYGCSFCDSRGTWTRKVRRMSHDRLVEEIWAIKREFGTNFFSFQDDCLVTKQSVAIDMCNKFKEAGLASLPREEFRWWCEIHPNVITQELVRNLKEAGCVAIAIGAESGSQRSLKQVAKGSSLESIRRAAEIIRSEGLSLTMFFIIGFPWETEEDILETLDFMEECEPDNPALSVLTPLPGTPIFDYCLKSGLLNPEDNEYRSHFHQRADSFYNLNIPQSRAAELIEEGFRRCSAVLKKRKSQRLITFFRDRLEDTLLNDLDYRLLVSDQNIAEKPMASVDGSAPRHLLIDSDWETQSLKLEIRVGETSTKMDEKVEGYLKKAFTTEFPEYENIDICVRTG
ncbi:hypothetical protein GCM10017044_00360 [Kordiimonas sediminis]|uniref:Radical SAM protein n=1 Tax=Kordiimonas sediminis TaxID=1735581 RepID=A0A919E453_9PROT|nr:radical SAM protein [Kordiimonas sediminis]GHF10605.1 hypothetical protein GCM10017044_00360 [Kordiimonas sediminis]